MAGRVLLDKPVIAAHLRTKSTLLPREQPVPKGRRGEGAGQRAGPTRSQHHAWGQARQVRVPDPPAAPVGRPLGASRRKERPMTDFSMLGLNPGLLAALERMGITQSTPIQTRGIPPVMDGRDLLALTVDRDGRARLARAPCRRPPTPLP